MRASVVQLAAAADVTAAIDHASSLVSAACRADRPDLVVLPEMWSCLGGNRATKLDVAEAVTAPGGPATRDGTMVAALRDLARRERIVLHAGSLAEQAPNGRLFNTSLVIGRDGDVLCRYRKLHLFDVTTPSGDGYRESDLFDAGDEVSSFDLDDTRIGCAICYDLRFPRLFARLREAGAEIIALPAAFTAETGAAHWDVLLRARAIETQCWLLAAAMTGTHAGPDGTVRHTHGHSMIVDPWGRVVASLAAGEGWATAAIDRALTARIRRDLPVFAHRRLL